MLYSSVRTTDQRQRIDLLSQDCNRLDVECIETGGRVHILDKDGNRADANEFESDEISIHNNIKLNVGLLFGMKFQHKFKLNNGQPRTPFVIIKITKRGLTLTTAAVPGTATVPEVKPMVLYIWSANLVPYVCTKLEIGVRCNLPDSNNPADNIKSTKKGLDGQIERFEKGLSQAGTAGNRAAGNLVERIQGNLESRINPKTYRFLVYPANVRSIAADLDHTTKLGDLLDGYFSYQTVEDNQHNRKLENNAQSSTEFKPWSRARCKFCLIDRKKGMKDNSNPGLYRFGRTKYTFHINYFSLFFSLLVSGFSAPATTDESKKLHSFFKNFKGEETINAQGKLEYRSPIVINNIYQNIYAQTKTKSKHSARKVDCSNLEITRLNPKICRHAIALTCQDLTQQKTPSAKACADARDAFVKAYSKTYASAHEGAGDLAKDFTRIATLLKEAGTFALSEIKKDGYIVDKAIVQVKEKYEKIKELATVR